MLVCVLTLLAWLSLLVSAQAAVVNALSCSVSDVQNAVDAAATNDTVRLPACTQTTWTSTVTITKKIILEGAGTASTVIQRSDVSAGFLTNVMFLVSGVTGFEMREMTLDGTQDTNPNTHRDTGIHLLNCVDFRIHHMVLNDFAQAIAVQGASTAQRGLIDHNSFTGNYCSPNCGGSGSLGYATHVIGDGTYPALSLGTAQNVFIEDNTYNENRHNVASNNGSSYVFRYNTIQTQGANAAAVDVHGYPSSTWPRGSRQYEVYHNTISTDTSDFAGVGPRGGDGVIFNNVIGAASSNRDIHLMNELGCSGTYPLQDQIRELYIWGNTRPSAGGPAQIVVESGCTSYIQVNRDYFLTTRPGYTPYTYPHPGQGGAAPVPDLTSGLRMHLKFDEGTGTTAQDSTVNNHDGTLENGATWDAAKMGTSALSLDGTNDQVTVSGLLSSPAAITLAAWVLPSTYGLNGADVLSVGNVVTLRLTTTQLTAHYWNGTGFTTLAAARPTGALWQHVAYTATAGAQRLYVNGGLVASGSAAAALSFTGQGANTILGNHGNAGTTTRYGGLIDDARVYTRVLNTTDMAGLAALDDPPPLNLLITAPTTSPSYSTTSNLLANMGGVAADNVGVTGLTWTCPTCSTTSGSATCTPACGAATADVNWNIPSITFPAAGTHTITVTATDASSSASKQLAVTYTPSGSGGAACTHYASGSSPASGFVAGAQGNTGLTLSSPKRPVDMWAILTPGKVLCLLDGTYTGGNNLLQIPASVAGTSSQPITIRALNDGKVLVDGAGQRPVDLLGNWLIVEGLNVTRGNNANVAMRGNDSIVRRVVTWNNTGVQADAHLIDMQGNRNTCEDCAAFGVGEKIVTMGSSGSGTRNNRVRRLWVRGESAGSIASGASHNGVEQGYGQDGSIYENVLVTWNRTGTQQDHTGDFRSFRTWNSLAYGIMVYMPIGSLMGSTNLFSLITDGGSPQQNGDYHATTNTHYKDLVAYVQPGHSQFGSMRGLSVALQGPDTSGGSNTVDNVVAVAGVASSTSSNSKYTLTNVRTGATLTAALSGSGHSNIWTLMPRLCKQVVNGTTTTTGLWPWPMDQRISDALVASGRSALSVTSQVQGLFGTIPSQCLSGSIEEETCTPPRVGTPPTCTCPVGTVEPLCEPETPPATCPPECPVQDVFVVATAGSTPPGNNANACTLDAPCLTIDRALSLMTAADKLYLRAGTYSGTGNRITTGTRAIPAGGTWDTATTIAAYQGETVVLQQSTGTVITLNSPTTDRYIVFDRLIVDGATSGGNDTKALVTSGGAHHIRFQNGTLRNCHFTCLDIVDSNSIEVLNTTIHGTSHAQGASVSGTSDSVLFDGVTWHTNAGHGLNASGSNLSNLTVRNSTSRTNTGTGFQLGSATLLATNLLAYSNALGVRITSLAVDGRLYNATIADNSGVELQIDAGATDNLVTNVIAVGGITDNGTGTVQTTNLTTDPGFVGAGDYRLAANTSSAADTGTDLSAVFTTAIDGTVRPVGQAWDIGCFEREGDEGPPLPTPGALSARPWGSRQFLLPQ